MRTSVEREYENLKRKAVIEMSLVLLILLIKSSSTYSVTMNFILNILSLLCLCNWVLNRFRLSFEAKNEFMLKSLEILDISLKLRDEKNIDEDALKNKVKSLLGEMDEMLEFFQQRVPGAGITKELERHRESLESNLRLLKKEA